MYNRMLFQVAFPNSGMGRVSFGDGEELVVDAIASAFRVETGKVYKDLECMEIIARGADGTIEDALEKCGFDIGFSADRR